MPERDTLDTPISIIDMHFVIDKAGGVTALANDLGVTRYAVHQWRQRCWMPSNRAKQCRDLYDLPSIRGLLKPMLRDLD